MGKLLETAKYWRNFGIATIPVGYKSKRPSIKWSSYTEQMPTEDEMQYWFASDLANIAIIIGWQNLCIIDFDDMDVFLKWYIWTTETGGKAKETALRARMHKSARGMHVYILCENAENMKLPKIDVLAERKYALLPPSIHPTGVAYEVYQDTLPMPVNSLYDVLPKKLLDEAYAQKAPKAPAPSMTLSEPEPVIASVSYDPWIIAGKTSQQDQNLIASIKSQITIESILNLDWQDSGGAGRWKVARCPFHDDKNPSFWLDTVNQICGCHAGCTPLPLDVIDLYARLHGIDNTQAIKELAQRLS